MDDRIIRQLKAKPFPVSPFSLDETAHFLTDTNLDQSDIDDIHRALKGNPGALSSIKRALTSSADKRHIIEELHKHIPKPFEIEWNSISRTDARTSLVLAILAHSKRRLDIESLSRLAEIEVSELKEILNGISCIENVSESEWAFASEAFRRFVAEKLYSEKKAVDDLFIRDLLARKHSSESLNLLPVYLNEGKRYDDLLKYLSADTFHQMLAVSQTLTPVLATSDLAIHAAYNSNQNTELMRFAAHKSTIIQRQYSDISRSEIEARLALSDYSTAFALAQAAILKEDRLQTLSIVARQFPAALEEIRAIYPQIDVERLGERAIDIAADMIGVAPDIAIDLVERSTNSLDDDNATDMAYAKFSIAASQNATRDGNDLMSIIRERIKNPKFQRFSAAATLLVGIHSPEGVISEAERIENVGIRIQLLRQWLMENQGRTDTATVIDYGIKLIIQTTGYTPNARVFSELASPLPNVEDKVKLRFLIGLFDTQRPLIEASGPTEDYIALQLLLAEADAKIDSGSARNRLEDIFYQICEIAELDIRVNCLARFLVTVVRADPEGIFEARDKFRTVSESDLLSSLSELLNAVADHEIATETVLKTLSPVRPDLALKIASWLNVEPRRNQAYLQIIQSMAIPPSVEGIDFSTLESALVCIKGDEHKSAALSIIIENLSTIKIEPGDALAKEMRDYYSKIDQIIDEEERCRAYCMVIQQLSDNNDPVSQGMLTHLKNKLSQAWENMGQGRSKVDSGFKIAHAFADVNTDIAWNYLSKAVSDRDEYTLDGATDFSVYTASLVLAIRAFVGLLQGNRENDEDYRQLKSLIADIPGAPEQITIWNELALRAYSVNRLDFFHQIVEQHIRPSLQDASVAALSADQESAIVISAPALHLFNSRVCEEQINRLRPENQQRCWISICEFLLRRIPLSDAFDPLPGEGFRISYDVAGDVLTYADKIRSDATIYRFISAVADTAVSKRIPKPFTRQQRLDTANRMEELAKRRLPTPDFISHFGYRIAANAQVARLREEPLTHWAKIISDAKAIPNLSDKAFVLILIAGVMPSKFSAEQKSLLFEAERIIKDLPSDIDRVNRIESLATTAWSIDQDFARASLRQGMLFATAKDTTIMLSLQRRLVDFAYRYDPDFAASVASLVDDDPARLVAKNNLRRRLKTLKASKLLEGVNSLTEPDDLKAQDFVNAAWKWLGRINSGRASAFHISNLSRPLRAASELPLHRSYPVMAFAVESTMRRWAGTPAGDINIRPIFEAMIQGAVLARSLSQKSLARIHMAQENTFHHDSRRVMIRENEVDKARTFLQNWMSENVEDELLICDAHFTPNDVQILQLILEVKPDCRVRILTGKPSKNINEPWQNAYSDAWLSRSDQEPPVTDIYIVGTKGARFPIHDRYCVTKRAGLRIGTSFNGLGGRTSDIVDLTDDELEEKRVEILQYVDRVKRHFEGEKLDYVCFSL